MSWNEFLLPAKLVEATTHSSFTMDPINMENPRLNRSIEEKRAPAPFQKAARMQILGCWRISGCDYDGHFPFSRQAEPTWLFTRWPTAGSLAAWPAQWLLVCCWLWSWYPSASLTWSIMRWERSANPQGRRGTGATVHHGTSLNPASGRLRMPFIFDILNIQRLELVQNVWVTEISYYLASKKNANFRVKLACRGHGSAHAWLPISSDIATERCNFPKSSVLSVHPPLWVGKSYSWISKALLCMLLCAIIR